MRTHRVLYIVTLVSLSIAFGCTSSTTTEAVGENVDAKAGTTGSSSGGASSGGATSRGGANATSGGFTSGLGGATAGSNSTNAGASATANGAGGTSNIAGAPTSGGQATGGQATGGQTTGGLASGGQATGGRATGGQATGGLANGGQATGGQATGGKASGGQGGTVSQGTGGTTLLPLGRGCTLGSQCASNYCVDGVCCSSACDGPCMACNASGTCSMPADDVACGTIDCPSSTVCRAYSADLTSNRCKALGQCKTPNDCGFTNTAARYDCDGNAGPMLCDGAGECRMPAVKCGNVSACTTGNCCNGGTSLSAMFNCLPATQLCATDRLLTCDGSADCPLGQICCGIRTGTPFSSVCTTPGECIANPARGVAIMCDSSASNECTTPEVCTTAASGAAGLSWCD